MLDGTDVVGMRKMVSELAKHVLYTKVYYIIAVYTAYIQHMGLPTQVIVLFVKIKRHDQDRWHSVPRPIMINEI